MLKARRNRTIVDQLRRYIVESGMTRYAIGKQSGVSLTQLGRFISGKRDIRLETAAKICDVLNLELTER